MQGGYTHEQTRDVQQSIASESTLDSHLLTFDLMLRYDLLSEGRVLVSAVV